MDPEPSCEAKCPQSSCQRADQHMYERPPELVRNSCARIERHRKKLRTGVEPNRLQNDQNHYFPPKTLIQNSFPRNQIPNRLRAVAHGRSPAAQDPVKKRSLQKEVRKKKFPPPCPTTNRPPPEKGHQQTKNYKTQHFLQTGKWYYNCTT